MSESHEDGATKLTKSTDCKLQQLAGATASPKEDDNGPICPVCLQNCVYPVSLPCDHVFCFLCVKGFMARSRSCAICRRELPHDYCDRPQILDRNKLLASSQRGVSSDGSQWFYSGASGWWQYEDRIAKELEEAYNNKKTSIEISISGFQYKVDFGDMVQYQVNDPYRRRKIKRDAVTITKKGIAGIALADEQLQARTDKTEADDSSDQENQENQENGNNSDEVEDTEESEEVENLDAASARAVEEITLLEVTDSSHSRDSDATGNELTSSFQGLSLEDSKDG